MRVLLAGASGTLAGSLLPQLASAGHEVVGITRDPGAASRLRAQGHEAVVADVLDHDGLLVALDGVEADAVMHQMTALRRAPTTYGSMSATNDLRDRGTAHLVDAAHLVGAARMVTQSIVFGYGYRDHGRKVLDETAPFARPEGTRIDPTMATLAAAEQRTFDSGLEGVALRYGMFYGRDRGAMVDMIRRRMIPVTRWNGAIPFVHHDDAAAAAVAALERGVHGRAYNIATEGPESWSDLIRSMAAAVGAPAPFTAPAWLLRAAGPYAALLATRMNLRVSSRLAARELGWTPRYPTLADGWRAPAL